MPLSAPLHKICLVAHACNLGMQMCSKGSRSPVPYCAACDVTWTTEFLSKQTVGFSNISVYEQISWQCSQMAIYFEGSKLLWHSKCSGRKLNEICIFSDIANWHRLFCLLTYALTFFSGKPIDVGFPSACSEYVLLPLVEKEAASAYGRTEYSQPGRDERESRQSQRDAM